jgi:hypothetical protein
MMKMLIVAAVLGLGAVHAAERSQVFELARRMMDLHSLDVDHLRFCGNQLGSNEDAKNAEFAACAMYVLGVVDMMREWQKIDPVHALPMCIPQNAQVGDLITAVKKHIEPPLGSGKMPPRR